MTSRRNSLLNLLLRYFLLPLAVFLFFKTATSNGIELQVCGRVIAANKTLSLKQGEILEFEDFESIRSRRLKGAVFLPVVEHGCVIKVCGYTWTQFFIQKDYKTRNYADCQIIQKGDQAEVSSNIYNDLFNLTSISCGCRNGSHQADTTNACSKGCRAKMKEKVDWKGYQCAILYEEGNCSECWFEPVVLHIGQNYRTDNSHYVSSLLVREECTIEQALHKSATGERLRVRFGLLTGDTNNEESLKWGYSSFTCRCKVTFSTTATTEFSQIINSTFSNASLPSSPFSTATTVHASEEDTTKLPTYYEIEVSTSNASASSKKSCAYIKPMNNVLKIELFEDRVVDRQVFSSIRVGKLENALFVPGVSWTDTTMCVLEICGFNNEAKPPYKYGKCELYSGPPLKAPSNIYTETYKVSSLGCSCRTNSTINCADKTCLLINATKEWTGRECGILFREQDCKSCYFRPITLLLESVFPSLNSFQFKSMIIRPGCWIEKVVNGGLWFDEPWVTVFKGGINNTTPAFHQDSENFTCFCDPSVIKEMTANVTAGISSTTLFTSINSIIISVGVVLVIALGTVGVILTKRRIDKRRHSVCENPISTIQNWEKQAATIIQDEQLGKTNSSVERCIEINPTIICNVDEGKTTGSQLKMEIMDEVTKMMESFLASLGHDEIDGLNRKLSQKVSTEPMDSSRVNDFTILMEKFHHVCSPSRIIARGAFTVPRRELETPLGSGVSGIVYKGFLKQEPDGLHQVVAVKKLQWPCSSNLLQSFLREISIFEMMIGDECEHIVEFLGACCHNDGLYLVTSFCELGSLKQYLLKEMRPQIFQSFVVNDELMVNIGNGYFAVDHNAEVESVRAARSLSPDDLLQLLCWCEQIASGMEYLSIKGIIHVDLAIRNILISAGKIVKICDFGLSRQCLQNEDCARTLLTGDFPFNSFAPECNIENIHEARQVTLHVDIWAMGCTLWEVFTLGEPLYPDVTQQGMMKFLEIRRLLLEGYRHPKPQLAPEYIYQLLLECWHPVPHSRPNFNFLKTFFNSAVTAHLATQHIP